MDKLVENENILDKEETPLPYSTHDLRWCSGTCKICGEHADVQTYYHAGLHGYDNIYDFIKDGNILFDFEKRKKK